MTTKPDLHRYVVSGVLDDMRAGRLVVVAATGEVPTSRLFLQVAEQVLLEPDAHRFRVYRSRGQQRITVEREGSWRGVAHFHTVRTLSDFARGHAALDVVVTNAEADVVRRAVRHFGEAMLDIEIVRLDQALVA